MASTAKTNANTMTVKSMFIALLSLTVTLTNGRDTVIGGFADPGGRNY